MVAPAFGFSAGDFIAAIQLLKCVSRALKSTGGAAEDYQRTTAQLNNLVEILQCFQVLSHGDTGLDADHRIWEIADGCQNHLQGFLDRQTKYWNRLGPDSTSRWSLKTGIRKVRWALSTSKDVDVLWGAVRRDLDAIGLALSLQSFVNNAASYREQMQLLRDIHDNVVVGGQENCYSSSSMALERSVTSLKTTLMKSETNTLNAIREQNLDIVDLRRQIEQISLTPGHSFGNVAVK